MFKLKVRNRLLTTPECQKVIAVRGCADMNLRAIEELRFLNPRTGLLVRRKMIRPPEKQPYSFVPAWDQQLSPSVILTPLSAVGHQKSACSGYE